MNRCETLLFLGFTVLFLSGLGLHHFMAFRLNQQLPPGRRIPQYLGFYSRGWIELVTEYKSFYPRSSLYQFTLAWAICCLIIAGGLAGVCIWEYATGR
jgi:hypothetical protein